MLLSNDRYTIALANDEGVLLDLQSGVFVQLNETAAFVWSRWVRGHSRRDIERELLTAYETDPAEAAACVTAALDWDSLELPVPPPSEFNFAFVDDVFVFSYLGKPMLEVTPDGRRLRVLGDVPNSNISCEQLLSSATPKVLALQGVPVLHASAIETPGGVVVFSGESGAGKTTLAKLMQDVGFPVVSEDKVVLDLESNDSQIAALVDAEPRLARWAAIAATRVSATGSGWMHVDFSFLDRAPRKRVSRAFFLEATDRRGSSFKPVRLSAGFAIGDWFKQLFLARMASAHWNANLERAQRLALSVSTHKLSSPDGLPALRAAVRSQSEKLTGPTTDRSLS